ncbi:hypothetical protein DVJ77_12005 [Dyella tabacisoli]|uniref:Uncharacterized protein n=2 Tax=Dyella tabacisoli TaxID=2282381 RepID=A0A369UP83_9GAMM|nr:hypothetical protein DVJ77_12005 [Dyella tabacisoli]
MRSLLSQAIAMASDALETPDRFEFASLAGAASVASPVGTTISWAERSLRFIRQREGGLVAWLRDYRAEGDEVSQMVNALRQEAKAQGLVLQKIMLNGREAWTSRNNL